MNCVTWYEAMAFCVWDGGYLATEAEWNYAATGGDQQRAYPWSIPAGSLTPFDGSHASYSDGTNCMGDGLVGCAVTDMVEVGTKPMGDGRWSQSDLAGNVHEWTLDWYATTYASPCMDCAGLTATLSRVVRGGGFDERPSLMRAGARHDRSPEYRDHDFGFRCARNAPWNRQGKRPTLTQSHALSSARARVEALTGHTSHRSRRSRVAKPTPTKHRRRS